MVKLLNTLPEKYKSAKSLVGKVRKTTNPEYFDANFNVRRETTSAVVFNCRISRNLSSKSRGNVAEKVRTFRC